MSGGNLAKRIKRHVRGASHMIQAVCHPDIQDLAEAELRELGFQPERPDRGLLEFSGRITDVYRLHLKCRLPASFRIKLAEFRCGSREDLFRQVRNIPWEYWLLPHSAVKLRLSTTASRLSHEGRAASSVLKAIQGRLNAELEGTEVVDAGSRFDGNAPVQKIFVSVRGSRASVSLDATGDLLYRRGWGKGQGKAPIRENIGAAILSAAPFAIPPVIVDGMSGSGTLFTEAIMTSLSLVSPGCRQFTFFHWPVFSKDAWEFLRRTCVQENRASLSQRVFQSQQTQCAAEHPLHVAVEIDPAVFRLLTQNIDECFNQVFFGRTRSSLQEGSDDVSKGIDEDLSQLKVSPLPVDGIAFDIDQICLGKLWNQDFFAWVYELIPRELGGQWDSSTKGASRGLLLLNPPYDWRLPREDGFYSRIWHVFLNLLPQWLGIVLVPLDARGTPMLKTRDRLPDELLQRATWRDFPHGGRRVRVFYISSVD